MRSATAKNALNCLGLLPSKPSGLGCWLARGLLPAENARKRAPPKWFNIASAKMLRAELWVHKNSTFKGWCGHQKKS